MGLASGGRAGGGHSGKTDAEAEGRQAGAEVLDSKPPAAQPKAHCPAHQEPRPLGPRPHCPAPAQAQIQPPVPRVFRLAGSPQIRQQLPLVYRRHRLKKFSTSSTRALGTFALRPRELDREPSAELGRGGCDESATGRYWRSERDAARRGDSADPAGARFPVTAARPEVPARPDTPSRPPRTAARRATRWAPGARWGAGAGPGDR